MIEQIWRNHLLAWHPFNVEMFFTDLSVTTCLAGVSLSPLASCSIEAAVAVDIWNVNDFWNNQLNMLRSISCENERQHIWSVLSVCMNYTHLALSLLCSITHIWHRAYCVPSHTFGTEPIAFFFFLTHLRSISCENERQHIWSVLSVCVNYTYLA